MGLDVVVGVLAGIDDDDQDARFSALEEFEALSQDLVARGLPAHREPVPSFDWSERIGHYSTLHFLRRIAAYADAGRPLPTPECVDAAADPVLQACYGSSSGWLSRVLQLLRLRPRFQRRFEHLIQHSDCEGYYVPIEFREVILARSERVPGGYIGSVQRLRAELCELAAIMSIPDNLAMDSEELLSAVLAAESNPRAVSGWQRYPDETRTLLVLRAACDQAMKTGAAIVFC